jgi:two-component system nitrogen regulation response regulator NtrX
MRLLLHNFIFATVKDQLEQLKLTSMNLKEARSMFEKFYLEKMLENFEWNISRTAEAIGIERSNLHRKIKRYGIKAPPIKK